MCCSTFTGWPLRWLAIPSSSSRRTYAWLSSQSPGARSDGGGVGRHGQAQAQAQAQVQVLVGGESGSWAEAAQLEASERRLMLRAAVHKASATITNRELALTRATESALLQLVLVEKP